MSPQSYFHNFKLQHFHNYDTHLNESNMNLKKEKESDSLSEFVLVKTPLCFSHNAAGIDLTFFLLLYKNQYLLHFNSSTGATLLMQILNLCNNFSSLLSLCIMVINRCGKVSANSFNRKYIYLYPTRVGILILVYGS
jgi:hypothetical protein